MHRIRALLAGIVLAALIVGPVAAADVTDTFTVNSAVSMSGLPASVNYGAVDPGAISAVQTFNLTISGNRAWELDISGTDFTGGVSKLFRHAQLTATSGPITLASGANTWNSFAGPPFDATIPAATGTAGAAVLKTELRVAPPANATAGEKNGTMTFVLTGL